MGRDDRWVEVGALGETLVGLTLTLRSFSSSEAVKVCGYLW
jgi:hypothetical protein